MIFQYICKKKVVTEDLEELWEVKHSPLSCILVPYLVTHLLTRNVLFLQLLTQIKNQIIEMLESDNDGYVTSAIDENRASDFWDQI